NGAKLCSTDASASEVPCPPGVPENVPPAHVRLMYAPLQGVLGGQAMTGVVALPLSSITLEGAAVRATAMLFWEPPPMIDATARAFPAFPGLPETTSGRRYAFDAPSPDIHVNVVT